VRNNAGAHGEAPTTPAVPDYIAGFALHMTAASLVLLGKVFSTKQRVKPRTTQKGQAAQVSRRGGVAVSPVP
jgi:hypothetical protein